MTLHEAVYEFLPNITQDQLEHLVWSHTGYPSFFRKEDPEAHFREQIKEFAEKFPDADCHGECYEEMDRVMEEVKTKMIKDGTWD